MEWKKAYSKANAKLGMPSTASPAPALLMRLVLNVGIIGRAPNVLRDGIDLDEHKQVDDAFGKGCIA